MSGLKIPKASSIYKPNLLLNGDFQIWQRGASFNFEANTETRYTADMWYVWGYAGLIYKVENGIAINGSTRLSQFIEKLKVGKNYTLSLSINGKEYSYTFKGGSTYNNRRVHCNVLDKYDRIEIDVNNETINWVQLVEGTTAPSHVKEDCATALLRCQKKLIVIDSGDRYLDIGMFHGYDNIVFLMSQTNQMFMDNYPTVNFIGQGLTLFAINGSSNIEISNPKIVFRNYQLVLLETPNYINNISGLWQLKPNCKIIMSCEPL